MTKKKIDREDIVTGAMVAGSMILAFEGMSVLRNFKLSDYTPDPLAEILSEMLKGDTPVNIGAGIVEDNFYKHSVIGRGSSIITDLIKGVRE